MNTRRTQEYEEIRGRLVLKMLPARQIVEDIHSAWEIGDMHLVFMIENKDGSHHIITNGDLARYGVSPERIYVDAMNLAIETNPPVVIEQRHTLPAGKKGRDITQSTFKLTTLRQQYGAAAIAYPHMLQIIAQRLGDFSIVSISDEEFCVLPDSGFSCRSVVSMPKLWGLAQKRITDRLTDNTYHYELATDSFETAEEYTGRMLLQEALSSGEDDK